MNFVGHKSEDGRYQLLIDHLKRTSDLCASFAAVFGMEEAGKILGLYHDIGKYSQGFQDRILKDGQKIDHSTAGARELLSLKFAPLIFSVAGHHSGLLNYGTQVSEQDGTLIARLKNFEKRLHNNRNLDYSNFKKEVSLRPQGKIQLPVKFNTNDPFRCMFLTRMLHSCLVDADRLDTEHFMNPDIKRGGFDSLEEIYKKFKKYIGKFEFATTALNQKRSEILKVCIQAGENKGNIFSLTVPTGGGKTISSLGFALECAQNSLPHKKRIIYVLPYTSVIEQNADVYREIAGTNNIVEHHINVDYDKNEEFTEEIIERHKLATENWDAPIIITTNVQFFESLYACNCSRCRKLHNIAESIVIFDEAQMFPIDFLKPCIRGIQELVANYGVIAVLCTATQPSLNEFFPEDFQIKEICNNPEELYEFFKRATYEYLGKINLKDLIEKLNAHSQVLCIVNTRRLAQSLYDKLEGEGCYHLSANMCPEHRREKLKEIKERLAANLECKVVATSLVEAGVDIDFPVVYREIAGLDSIIQSAGRCNREGKHSAEESKIYVFSLPNELQKLPNYIRLPAEVTKMVIERHKDMGSIEAIKDYFSNLHNYKGENLDKNGILEKCKGVSFVDIAKDFELIEDNTRNVFVTINQASNNILKDLRAGKRTRELLRRMAQYVVRVYENQYKQLLDLGQIEIIDENISVLTDLDSYHKDKGLVVNMDDGNSIFC